MAEAKKRKTTNASPAKKKTAGNNKKNPSSVKKRAESSYKKQTQNSDGRFDGSPELSSEKIREIYLYIYLAVNIFLVLGTYGVCGVIGNAISGFFFGIFGAAFYVLPFYFFIAAGYILINGPKPKLVKIITWIFVAFMAFGFIMQMNAGTKQTIETLYKNGYVLKKGGGVIFGGILVLLAKYTGEAGSILITVLLLIVSVIEVTGISFIDLFKKFFMFGFRDREINETEDFKYSDSKYYDLNVNHNQKRDETKNDFNRRKNFFRNIQIIDKDNDGFADSGIPKSDGVFISEEELHELRPENASVDGFIDNDSELSSYENPVINNGKKSEQNEYNNGRRKKHRSDDVIVVHDENGDKQINLEPYKDTYIDPLGESSEYDADAGVVHAGNLSENKIKYEENKDSKIVLGSAKHDDYEEDGADIESLENISENGCTGRVAEPDLNGKVSKKDKELETEMIDNSIKQCADKTEKIYEFPSVNLLKTDGRKNTFKDSAHVRDTAQKLKATLESFGVNVTITNCSVGPTVTRYEMQPEQGVKVSRILSLQDDIKLNLAATDIRIEAPIPGKAAIGIEVPNKENSIVYFRDLIDNDAFHRFKSNLAFAVGKDISGQIIISDIAKMPHLLIAGATGSGKSVCINTIIMSILYKASPKDVRMIMIDPKMVELTAYNGIPHLLIPVVTDPKKAAGALNWVVDEMSKRFQTFAKYNVRNIDGFNKKVEKESLINTTEQNADSDEELKHMPQLLVIVDELADLMMVAHGEVEDSIVRLSQLARAAGIHLVIATQRPSVDVITGLIKANVPSRIAFSVASGVDSRTILDMNGAEKLLGKGDMLFYPTGYTQPVRVQGAFISDDEVVSVVDFIKNDYGSVTYEEDVAKTIETSAQNTSGGSEDEDETHYDEYFEDAGRLVIEKDKASIGYLQRVFRIGFNRAARIMDQLTESGVVGPEEGTKPRKVLMTIDEFETMINGE